MSEIIGKCSKCGRPVVASNNYLQCSGCDSKVKRHIEVTTLPIINMEESADTRQLLLD